jgi:nitrogen fixation protein FixH
MGHQWGLVEFFMFPGVWFALILVAVIIAIGLLLRSRKVGGKMILALAVGFFAVVTGVNFYMAFSAVGSFPGLEVENGYIASQTFDVEREAQEALGWDVQASLDGDAVRVEILGANGTPATLASINGMIGRTTERNYDQELTFSSTSTGAHVAPITPLDFGKWELRLAAVAADGTPFRQRIVLIVPES